MTVAPESAVPEIVTGDVTVELDDGDSTTGGLRLVTVVTVIVIEFDGGDVILPIVDVAVIVLAPVASVAVILQLPEASAVTVPSSVAPLYTLTMELGVCCTCN